MAQLKPRDRVVLVEAGKANRKIRGPKTTLSSWKKSSYITRIFLGGEVVLNCDSVFFFFSSQILVLKFGNGEKSKYRGK